MNGSPRKTHDTNFRPYVMRRQVEFCGEKQVRDNKNSKNQSKHS